MVGKLLEGGLILRPLTEVASDKEKFAEFMHIAFEEEGNWRETKFTAWINDLLNERHPTMSLKHVWCVVDPAKNGKIVSGLFLIPQVWRYEDVEIPVGRPEIVATHADYRRRGLVRELFTVLHDYSEAQGHLLQAITGIPYFYRQFGYGFTVDLGSRGQIPFTAIPKLGKDEKIRLSLRKATVDDIPTLIQLDKSETRYALLTAVRDEALWHYELTGRNPKSFWQMDYQMIVNESGEAIGYIALNNSESADYATGLWRWVIGDKSNYLETFEDTLRVIREYIRAENDKIIALDVTDSNHPIIVQLMQRNFGMYTRNRMYAWYLRIPDHVKFIKAITPVLERRLANSPLHNYTGELLISFYERDDLFMKFGDGKIVEVSMNNQKFRPHARFPFDTWLNLVFGANTEAEIHTALPDALNTAEAAILLDILFLKKKSILFAIG